MIEFRDELGSMARYAKQIRFDAIGTTGQRRLLSSRVAVVGCGALGSVSANLLARAGIGQLILIDRDFVELDNLQRQMIYDEGDIGMPKAVVAGRKLAQVNSSIRINTKIADLTHFNIAKQLELPVDLIIDATDNFEIRFLINDLSVRESIPWIYAGCLGAEGQVMTVLPGQTPCLTCLMPDGPPQPGSTPTCDTGGVLATIINVIAAIQVNEALKLLTQQLLASACRLHVVDLWNNRFQSINAMPLRSQAECQVCVNRQFNWLSGDRGSRTAVLCGRNAVQLNVANAGQLDLVGLAARLRPLGHVEFNDFIVRFSIGQYVLNVFEDGRAIVNGTDDISVAKKLYAQYIGV